MGLNRTLNSDQIAQFHASLLQQILRCDQAKEVLDGILKVLLQEFVALVYLVWFGSVWDFDFEAITGRRFFAHASTIMVGRL